MLLSSWQFQLPLFPLASFLETSLTPEDNEMKSASKRIANTIRTLKICHCQYPKILSQAKPAKSTPSKTPLLTETNTFGFS